MRDETAPAAEPQIDDRVATEPDAPYQIDLPTALRLAGANSLQVELAISKIAEAESRLKLEKARLLPTLRIGASYQVQDGLLQETNGTPLEVRRSSRYTGFGAGAAGAGQVARPGLSLRWDLAEVFYNRLAARQMINVALADHQVTSQQTMLRAALAFYRLLGARAAVELAQDAHANATDLATITSKFVDSGLGLRSDRERAAVQELVWSSAIFAAERKLAQASAGLVRILRLNPETLLDPQGDLSQLELVNAALPLTDLVTEALKTRHDLAAISARIEAGNILAIQEQKTRYLPKVGIDASLGSFGAGRSLSPVDDYDHDRVDLSLFVYWQFEGLGFASPARLEISNQQTHQARLRHADLKEHIAAQLSVARSDSLSLHHQINIAATAIRRAEGSLALNCDRIRQNTRLPIETLQAIQSLASARAMYADSIIEYNFAQLRLHAALGRFSHASSLDRQK